MASATGKLALIVGSGASADDVAAAISIDPPPEPVTANGRHVLMTEGVAVLSRHRSAPSRGFTPAHLLDHEANLATLAELGCDRILAVCSVGSLRPDLGVGSVVAADDFFALGISPTTFADERGHLVPGFDQTWRSEVVDAWWQADTCRPIRDRGTYAHMPGPRFETPSEVRFLATVADVVGMTAAAECVLAGEMGLPYAAVCQVDNMANGVSGEHLRFDEVAANAGRNASRLTADIAAVTRTLK